MHYIKMFFPSGWIECVVVQIFVSNLLSYITVHNNRREKKIQTKDELNHNKYMHTCIINHYTYTFPQVDSVALA